MLCKLSELDSRNVCMFGPRMSTAPVMEFIIQPACVMTNRCFCSPLCNMHHDTESILLQLTTETYSQLPLRVLGSPFTMSASKWVRCEIVVMEFIKRFYQGFFWQILSRVCRIYASPTYTQLRLCFLKGKYLYVVQLNAHHLRVKPLWWEKMLGEVVFPVFPLFKDSLLKCIFPFTAKYL